MKRARESHFQNSCNVARGSIVVAWRAKKTSLILQEEKIIIMRQKWLIEMRHIKSRLAALLSFRD